MIKIPIAVEPASVGTLPVEPSFSLDGTCTYRRNSMKSQGGDYITKSRATDSDETFSLRWVNLIESEFVLLRDFFLLTIGPLETFLWRGERWNFREADFNFNLISVGPTAGKIYNAEIVLEKIPEICPLIHPTSS
jgi:hypothetical protein